MYVNIHTNTELISIRKIEINMNRLLLQKRDVQLSYGTTRMPDG